MTVSMEVIESDERKALRQTVSDLGQRFGPEYIREKVKAGEGPTELWKAAGDLGLVGVNIAEEFGGGGAGMYELGIVGEELAAAGAPLLMLVVSPAINGTILSRYGTDEQKKHWLPGIASGETIAVFAITEPDAGSNSHRITTTARRDGADWIISGQKTFISGVELADVILVVTRTEDAKTGNLRPALFLMPTDAPGLKRTKIEMEVGLPESQWQLFFDDVRLPAEALVGEPDAAIAQLFAGLNPERIMAAAGGVGSARFAIDRAVDYAKGRTVFRAPIGAHQAIAHPLAELKVETELAKLMLQKAATLYDAGQEFAAAESANMAKFAGGEAGAKSVDRAIHTLGGNGLTTEYGLAQMLVASRLFRIAPVSREMVLNFIAEHSLGLPKSY
ncbi:acyl-CoA dehydrogenase [Tsukamurella sp. 8F]|uniref:acyl-CoA dehydrogenase family protein n=1 Tax=unclassified Tsukamurella TaxID=2633480 RepID=UPI0023B8E27B|nr:MULTISPECIES: acyl-CoA dehydrogenase [unclassified Tsukamurella]MDF0532111.1 acyl-CoA dehydrogenase [Tsukamurella sp. 8J]MDF0589211.1 acyl-CoA dehydrogenase [Tsukamurella sp. 8F]